MAQVALGADQNSNAVLNNASSVMNNCPASAAPRCCHNRSIDLLQGTNTGTTFGHQFSVFAQCATA